jgi:AcrR family transcriptional regulator
MTAVFNTVEGWMAKRSSETTGASPVGKREVPYHHGALRQALLDAAESLLEESGLEGFTLRECARRAGVSHGAPAHHFGDVRGLLTAFTAQSFEQMAALTARYVAAAQPGAYERLVAGGVAYLDYALAHRARFQLMFRSDRLDVTDRAFQVAASPVIIELQDAMAAVLEASGTSKSALPRVTALAWSTVHGFANLMLDNQLFADRVGNAEAARRMFIDLMRASREVYERGAPPAVPTDG